MSNIIRAESPSKFLPVLPFHAEVVERIDDDNVVIEFEDENIQPQDGLRICADLYGPTMLALMLFDGTKNLKHWKLSQQIENDPAKKGQPTYVMGVEYANLKKPRRIDAPMREKAEKPVIKMNLAELQAYAAKNEIDLGEATTRGEMIAAIKEFQNKDGAE